MATFEECVEAAESELKNDGSTTAETRRFKAIAYALLALAKAIHDK